MKSPDRWNDTLIKSPHGDLSKQDVFDFYNSPGIKKHVLKSIGDNSFIVRQTFKPGNTVLRRKMPNGALINKSHLPKLLETRATEIHPTFGKKVDTILADIDPQKGVPWKKTKSITELVAKTMMSSPDVKDVSVRFSGGTGFYVQGKLPKPIDVNKARDLSKQILDGITKRPDVTFGVAKPGQIRIDTTPLKVRGSIRGAYSLNATTGLVSAPVTMAKLPKVEKSDFTVKSVLKRAAAMHFPKGYGPAVAAGKKNTTVRMFNELGKYKTDETYDSPQGKIHIDSVVRAKVKELRDHGILQSSLKRIAREGGKPSTPVDLIRFRKVSTHKSSIPASILEEALKDEYLGTGMGADDIHAMMSGTYPDPITAIKDKADTVGFLASKKSPWLPNAIVGNLFVSKGARGKGLGTAALKAFAEAHPDALSGIDVANLASKRVHEKAGFEPTGEKWKRSGNEQWRVKRAADLYHGGPNPYDTLQPMPVPGLSGKKLLYAAPRRGVALAYTRRWSDNDLGQGFVSPDEPAYLTEMRPNAFKDIFEGQPGYLHTIPAETFRPLGGTAISGEHVSEKPVKATKVEHITDALQSLKDSGVVLNEYDPTSEAFKQEMFGMKQHVSKMKPADRKRYLRWRLRNSTKDVKDAWKKIKEANYDDILEGIKNEQLRQQLLPALQSYEAASDPSHGITHIREVVNAARQIMPETGVDPEQVLTAAILHDIGREHEMQTGEAHHVAGARMAKSYLQPLDYAARRNVLHAIRQHSSIGQPRTLMAKVVRDADKLPSKMDNVVLPRRMAEYRIARGIPADQIAEDARKYILEKRKFKPDKQPSLLTPKAIEMAKPFEAMQDAMINDPVKWQAAMQPFLPKQAADEVQQVSGAPTPQAIASAQRKAFGLTKKELANGVPLTMQQVPTPTGEAQNAVLLKVSKEFAPGIPMNRKIKPIPKATNQPWTLAVQYHKAKKAGPHYDLRLVPSIGGDAHSWALPKATLPESGKMRLAIQQPTHTADYALNFEGKISKGYGAGTVTMPIKEQVNVIKAGPHSIMFQRPNKDKFTMFRMGDTKWGIKKISSAAGIFEKIADLVPASYAQSFPGTLGMLNLISNTVGDAFGISAGKARHHSAKVKRLARSKFLAKPKVTAFIRDHMRA